MGLLDDAIREHLDLKRRRGADPTEVEREEREVLGPVRPRVEAGHLEEHAHEDDLEYEPIAQGNEAWDDRYSEAAAAPEPMAAPPAPAPYRADTGYEEPPATEETTVEYSVEDALEEADADLGTEEVPLEREVPRPEGDEDVLEETPDFLQDTPDHDRLWFEQRPPRDFDFDG